MTDEFPRLDDCADLYVTAYRSFGLDAFNAEQIGLNRDEDQIEDILDFAIAYGLLERDEGQYRVRIAPDASADRWETLAIERTQSIRQVVVDRSTGAGPDRPDDEGGGGDASDENVIHHDGRRYASVFVTDSDDFDSVITDVATTMRTSGTDGIVLRSAAELANRVQRFADRLCDADAVTGDPLSEPLQKVGSDVEGEDKDTLEFRLFVEAN